MLKSQLCTAAVSLILFTGISCKNDTKKMDSASQGSAVMEKAKGKKATFEVTPIEHASAVFTIDTTVFYIDPVGGGAAYQGQPKPDIILVTDIHGDHLNKETLEAVAAPTTKIIVPQAVADQLGDVLKEQRIILNNDEAEKIGSMDIKAIPMYNLREEAKQFHTKGRGNGYVISRKDFKVYFSGDTEDIPEMRSLKNIDVAFVCMNLPYTMPVDKAVDAVLAFKPKKVYPYHYRGQEGLSNVAKFKTLVTQKDPDIEVIQLDWYPNGVE